MEEGSCAEMPVGGVGRLLHQARRVAGRARAAGHGGLSARAARRVGLRAGPGPPGVPACRNEPQGMAACPPGAGGLWGHGYGCFARRDSYLL